MATTYNSSNRRQTLRELGIEMLTGEACAFSLRILCDLNEGGVTLLQNALGIRIDRDTSPRNMNHRVNGLAAVHSVMLTHGQLDDLLVYGLAEAVCLNNGGKLVLARPKPENDYAKAFMWTGTEEEYRLEWLNQERDEESGEWVESGEGDEYRKKWWDWRVISVYEAQPHVGGRNVHAMSGRYE